MEHQSDCDRSDSVMELLRTKWQNVRKLLKGDREDKELKRRASEDSEEENHMNPAGKIEIQFVKENILDRNDTVYHEMDFTLKNPIIFCNNGNIIVRSKFAQRPPRCPAAKAGREKRRRLYGLDAVRHFVNKPVSFEKIKASHHHVGLITASKSAHSTPKIEKKMKAFKSESLQFFGVKTFPPERPPAAGDHMFLDFSRKSGKNGKTCTL